MEKVSIVVPSVQEIAKEALTSIPERYVRPDDERPVLSATTTNEPLPQVPVIDMAKLLSQDLNQSELQTLHHACKHWGFFQLINHGVSGGLVENVKKGVEEFFNLPMEEKNKLRQKEGEAEGYGQIFVVSEEQKLEWADMVYMVTMPPHLRKPHLFPNLPLPFRDNLETYCAEMKKLAIQMVQFMANALRVDPMEIKEQIGEGTLSMRMNYYPPCPQPELVMGLNPHSDGSSLTILLQVNEMQGLQIKKDGIWIPVRPLPNAFVINIGDILEIITNGIYKSIEHRAIVNVDKERLSIATFYNAEPHRNLGPVSSLVTPQNPAMFKTTTVAEYRKGYLSRELRGKSYLDNFKIHNQDENKKVKDT
ncbi:hypothetical protein AAHE18_03G365500 [Arachis hypogaea]|uniref:Fe2OG dioxygenase domain-containing protein n=1 Tax=Arachis hypogaea TaxID=3818 RepID=A0A445DLW9_ARAHY|nr:hypothetical protein DS421_3g105320 [Arachis hypogaea]RYR64170.1 hypothetical protein Ahy_A03g010298 isoform B [Arachis hypogaea]